MNIELTNNALKWFEEELSLDKGEYIRFHVKYGGSSPTQHGFSLAFNRQSPIDTGFEVEKNGVIYYVESEDLWYFDGHDLHIDVEDYLEGPIYDYKKN